MKSEPFLHRLLEKLYVSAITIIGYEQNVCTTMNHVEHGLTHVKGEIVDHSHQHCCPIVQQ